MHSEPFTEYSEPFTEYSEPFTEHFFNFEKGNIDGAISITLSIKTKIGVGNVGNFTIELLTKTNAKLMKIKTSNLQ